MQICLKQFSEKHLAVSFPEKFTDSMLDAVRKLPERTWNSEHKVWLIPCDQKTVDTLLLNIYNTKLFNFPEPAMTSELAVTPESVPKSVSKSSSEKHSPQHKKDLQKMQNLLRVKHYSQNTIEKYLKWTEIFIAENPDISDEKANQSINAFLTKLATKNHVSASTQNQALAALLFYFRFVKNVPVTELSDVVHAKKRIRIPVVFSREEV